MNPEPEDDKAPPEIRGGDRPSDYVPEAPKKISGMFGHHEDDDSVDEDGDEQ